MPTQYFCPPRLSLLVLALLSGGAVACETAVTDDQAPTAAWSDATTQGVVPEAGAVVKSGPAPSEAIAGIGVPVDSSDLADLRGGEATVDNEVLIDGTVDGNTADHVVSGSNVISDGAFTNATGISTVIQNSGSNVLIQNGMVVNVQFVAPPGP
jgi:hypothetical protein